MPEECSILKIFFWRYLCFQYTRNAPLLFSNQKTANISVLSWNESFKKALCSISKTTILILHVQQNFWYTFFDISAWLRLQFPNAMFYGGRDRKMNFSFSAALIHNLHWVWLPGTFTNIWHYQTFDDKVWINAKVFLKKTFSLINRI